MTLKLRQDKSIVGIDVVKAAAHYNAKYVMDTCVKDSGGGWVGPVALFYQDTAHEVSKSHYFALRVGHGRGDEHEAPRVWIMNGQSAVEHTYEGLVLDGEVYHSRYVHDFRAVGPDFIDGGLEYTRLVGLTLPIVKFKIVDGEAVFETPTYWSQKDVFAGEDAPEQHWMDKMFDEYNPKA